MSDKNSGAVSIVELETGPTEVPVFRLIFNGFHPETGEPVEAVGEMDVTELSLMFLEIRQIGVDAIQRRAVELFRSTMSTALAPVL